MDQNVLAAAATVSRGVIIDFEKGKRTPGANNLAAIQRALESAGVIFVTENGDGPGVRLRKAATGAPQDHAGALGQAEAAVDDKLIDVSATPAEKASRKRALTQIPKGMKSK